MLPVVLFVQSTGEQSLPFVYILSANQVTTTKPNTHLESKGIRLYRHVEMLRDSMSLQKKEMQTARADIGDAVAMTANIDSGFQMLESEMHSLWKKVTDGQAAHDEAAADKPSPIMPVRIFMVTVTQIHTVTYVHSYVPQWWVYIHECLLVWCHWCSCSWRNSEAKSISSLLQSLFPSCIGYVCYS